MDDKLMLLNQRKNLHKLFSAQSSQDLNNREQEHIVQVTLQTGKIYIQGEGALSLVQLSINSKLCCWKRKNYKLCWSKQVIKKLFDNYTSGSAPSSCIEISLLQITRW